MVSFGLWMGMALIFGSLSSVRRYAGDAEQGGVHHRGPDTCVTQSSPCWNGIKPSQSSNTPFAQPTDDEAKIRALENQFVAAVNAKDLDAIMKVYMPDKTLLVFDVVPSRQYVGAKAYR